MTKTILIISEPRDIHALVVKKSIETDFGYRCQILNFADLAGTLKILVQPGGNDAWRLGLNHADLDCANLEGLWVRRTFFPRPPERMSEQDKNISKADSREALVGLMFGLERVGIRMINPLSAEQRSSNKILQLQSASKCGMRIPKTTVTNDPKEVQRFSEELAAAGKKTSFKGFKSPPDRMIANQMLTADQMQQLHLLQYSPAIFQEYIEGGDARVTVVGNQIFPARVIAEIPEAAVDWRLQPGTPIERLDLPHGLAEKILLLMKDLGLVYGAMDFKITPEGEFVFLEVNPGGQFLFVEVHTGHEISKAIAGVLCGQSLNQQNQLAVEASVPASRYPSGISPINASTESLLTRQSLPTLVARTAPSAISI